jgi:hypothetical protein
MEHREFNRTIPFVLPVAVIGVLGLRSGRTRAPVLTSPAMSEKP